MKNNVPIYGILTILLIILRILIDKNPAIITIVAVINLVALLIVFHSVIEQIKTMLITTVQKTRVPAEIIERETKVVVRNVSLISYSSLALFSIIYLIFFRCSLGNDIITIFALGISLCDTAIVSDVVAFYKKQYHIGV